MRWTVMSKMMVVSLMGVVGVLGVAGAAVRGLGGIGESLRMKSSSGNALRAALEGDMMHDALRGDVLTSLLASTDQEHTAAIASSKEHAEWFRRSIKTIESEFLPPEAREAFQAVLPALEAYLIAADTICTMASRDVIAARARMGEFGAAFERLEESLGELNDRMQHAADVADTASMGKVGMAKMVLYSSVGATIVALMVVAALIARNIVMPLRACVDLLERLAEGDLTGVVELERSDEIGQLAEAANRAITSVSTMVGEINASAGQVAAAATEIHASSQDMSSSVAAQASEVEQIADAISTISGAVEEVARQSDEAARNAEESGTQAEQGGAVVNQTIEGMRSISETVQSSATSVVMLGERGDQIGKIIEVIRDIADQTNLLALNAAIEAARAGEHGRGFAVVADEVRKLADRTTKATGEIADSIKAMQHETSQVVTRIQTGSEQVISGVELATSAGLSLREIVTSSRRVSEMVRTIASSAERQLDTNRQTMGRLDSIRSVSQQASCGASQAAEAASSLSIKAEELNRMVSRFRVARRG